MKVTGAVVDKLILIKDYYDITLSELEAINDACNIIENFPNTTSVEDAKDFVKTYKAEGFEEVSLEKKFEEALASVRSLALAIALEMKSEENKNNPYQHYVAPMTNVKALWTDLEWERQKFFKER